MLSATIDMHVCFYWLLVLPTVLLFALVYAVRESLLHVCEHVCVM